MGRILSPLFPQRADNTHVMGVLEEDPEHAQLSLFTSALTAVRMHLVMLPAIRNIYKPGFSLFKVLQS
jgi:hypothetical protein